MGKELTNKTIDLRNNEIKDVTVPVANEEEIENTVKVMGGEDWEAWIQALVDADVLSDNAVTLAYSYIGPELTHAIYKEGSTVRQRNIFLIHRKNSQKSLRRKD